MWVCVVISISFHFIETMNIYLVFVENIQMLRTIIFTGKLVFFFFVQFVEVSSLYLLFINEKSS